MISHQAIQCAVGHVHSKVAPDWPLERQIIVCLVGIRLDLRKLAIFRAACIIHCSNGSTQPHLEQGRQAGQADIIGRECDCRPVSMSVASCSQHIIVRTGRRTSTSLQRKKPVGGNWYCWWSSRTGATDVFVDDDCGPLGRGRLKVHSPCSCRFCQPDPWPSWNGYICIRPGHIIQNHLPSAPLHLCGIEVTKSLHSLH